MIYFVRCEQDTEELQVGQIKIGTSVRLSQRLKQLGLEYGTEVSLIAIADGGHAIEGELHRRFDHLRVTGEWFEPGTELLEFIASDGRAWDGNDEALPPPSVSRDLKNVFLDRPLADMAVVVAKLSGISISSYLSNVMRPGIFRDYGKVVHELDKRQEK